MSNNDIFKKLRVALMLRDEQIVDILKLVDFRMSKAEVNAFFRAEDSSGYMACKDQVLRNFLNGLVIYLRGTKESPKDPYDQLAQNKKEAQDFNAQNEVAKPNIASVKKPRILVKKDESK